MAQPAFARICLLLLAGLSLGAGPAAPAPAVNLFGGSELPRQPEKIAEPGLDEQTLAQKPDLYLELIAGMQQRGLYYASLAHLDAFDARWPDRADAQLLRADALRATGQTEAARSMYGKLLEGPLAARAYHGLGLIAMHAGAWAEGSTALNRAAALAPTDATMLSDQGYAYLLLGKFAEARVALFKAAELDSKNKRIGANLVLLELVSGKIDQAQELLQRYNLTPAVREEILARAATIRNALGNTTELTP